MAKQEINIGSGYDTLDGDKLRDGGDKINKNFTEVYARATNWVAGVYPQRTTVLQGDKAYFLTSAAALPFTSSDFSAEVTAGMWKVLEGSNFFDSWIVTKRPGNANLGALESGDIVRGYWSATEYWDPAKYLGGDILIKANYQIFNSYENIT